MRPLTLDRPKPLLVVGGKTLLDHNLDQLAAIGVSRAVVNVHYLPGQIIAHLESRHQPAITISDEREELLDSGGGIGKVIAAFGDAPFFSLNADTIWLDGPRNNLERMREAFDPRHMDILLMVAPCTACIGWGNRGDFDLDQAGLLSFPEKPRVAAFAYTGVAILTPRLFANRPRIFSLLTLFKEAMAAGRLHGLRLDGVFMHVGTPEALVEAEQAMITLQR